MKEKVTILVLLLVLFAWGFHHSSLPEKAASLDDAAPSAKTSAIKSNAAPAVAAAGIAAVSHVGGGRVQNHVAPPESNADENGDDVPVEEIPADSPPNPYAAFQGLGTSKPATSPEELGKAMQGAEIDRQHLEERNLYFQKLSEQLKELQGGQGSAGQPPQAGPLNEPPTQNETGPSNENGQSDDAAANTPNGEVQEEDPNSPEQLDQFDDGEEALTPDEERALQQELNQ